MDRDFARRARLGVMYAAHGRAVLAYALRRSAQPADAADVVAETFLIAWRRLDVVPEGDEARLWLYGVARRVLANSRRGEQRRIRLCEKLRDSLTTQVSFDRDDAVAAVELVKLAMSELSPPDRELLELAAWEGLSAVQISAVLSVPAATVRTRLHRARARLRSALALIDRDGDHKERSPHPSIAAPALADDTEEHR